jgi:hypothetical protein
MERRAFLGTLAGAGVGGLAGCTVPGGQRTLAGQTISGGESETVLRFGDEADPLARSTIDYSDRPLTGHILPMRYLMWHRDGTTVESLRLAIRAPPAGHRPPGMVYLAVPRNGDIPEIDLHADDETGTPTIDIPDLGRMGEGTFGLEFYVEPTSDDAPLETRIELESRVTESGLLGATYRLEAATRVSLPRPDLEA